MKKTTTILAAACGLAAITSLPQALAKPAKPTSTAGMRFCKKGESPIIIVNGARVQVCRSNWDLSKGEIQAVAGIVAAANSDPNPELTKNRNLCLQVIERGQFEIAKPYCVKASQLGSAEASFALGIYAAKDDPKLDQEITRSYLDKASQGGSIDSTLLLAGYYARNGDTVKRNDYLLRCFDKGIVQYSTTKNSGYSLRSLTPSSYGYYKQDRKKCTNLALKAALYGSIPLAKLGINDVSANVINPSIEPDATIPDRVESSSSHPYFSTRLNIKSQFEKFDVLKLWDQKFRFEGDIIYKIMSINDNDGRPLAFSCAIFDPNEKPINSDDSDKICDLILLEHKLVAGIGKDGNKANGIASGRMHVDYSQFPGAPNSSLRSTRSYIENNAAIGTTAQAAAEQDSSANAPQAPVQYSGKGYLGVSISPVTHDVAEALGMRAVVGELVQGIQAGGPADKAGLRQGDVIYMVNGITINPLLNVSLPMIISGIDAGVKVRLGIVRQGVGTTTLEVVLGNKP